MRRAPAHGRASPPPGPPAQAHWGLLRARLGGSPRAPEAGGGRGRERPSTGTPGRAQGRRREAHPGTCQALVGLDWPHGGHRACDLVTWPPGPVPGGGDPLRQCGPAAPRRASRSARLRLSSASGHDMVLPGGAARPQDPPHGVTPPWHDAHPVLPSIPLAPGTPRLVPSSSGEAALGDGSSGAGRPGLLRLPLRNAPEVDTLDSWPSCWRGPSLFTFNFVLPWSLEALPSCAESTAQWF